MTLGCELLTVVPVTVPGTWCLCHGEKSVGDVGQKAVQVKHVHLHWSELRLLEALVGLFVQLGLADVSLQHIRQEMKTLTGSIERQTESVRGLAIIRGIPVNGGLTAHGGCDGV